MGAIQEISIIKNQTNSHIINISRESNKASVLNNGAMFFGGDSTGGAVGGSGGISGNRERGISILDGGESIGGGGGGSNGNNKNRLHHK